MDQLTTAAAMLRESLEYLRPSYALLAFSEFWDIVGPGGRLHPAYFLEHKGHLVIEALLVVLIFFLFAQGRFKPKARSEDPLTEKEIDQLCREWQPEPLVPEYSKEMPAPPVIESVNKQHVVIANRPVLNFCTADFLGMARSSAVMESCANTINKYGVGSCGPRGFYGTIDVHLELEKQLALFFRTPDAIIYSYDLATPASVIPTLVNRKDVIIVDEFVSFPIQQGCRLSKARVERFKHNDMADLERLLDKVNKEESRAKKPLNRRYVVVEAIYANHGDLAPLDKICELKNKYRWRLFVEESYSVGVLGATGRGACEHWGLDPEDVDATCGSMGTALGTVGGFCVGSKEVVDHQRLASQAYVFSASLPPYSAVAAIEALKQLAHDGRSFSQQLAARSRALRKELSNIPGTVLEGGPEAMQSPLMHLRLADASRPDAAEVLQAIIDRLLKQHSVLLGLHQISSLDTVGCPSSIKVLANVLLQDADIAKLGSSLRAAVPAVLGRR